MAAVHVVALHAAVGLQSVQGTEPMSLSHLQGTGMVSKTIQMEVIAEELKV